MTPQERANLLAASTGGRTYRGVPAETLFGGTARIAEFARCRTGMTVCADDVLTVEGC